MLPSKFFLDEFLEQISQSQIMPPLMETLINLADKCYIPLNDTSYPTSAHLDSKPEKIESAESPQNRSNPPTMTALNQSPSRTNILEDIETIMNTTHPGEIEKKGESRGVSPALPMGGPPTITLNSEMAMIAANSVEICLLILLILYNCTKKPNLLVQIPQEKIIPLLFDLFKTKKANKLVKVIVFKYFRLVLSRDRITHPSATALL